MEFSHEQIEMLIEPWKRKWPGISWSDRAVSFLRQKISDEAALHGWTTADVAAGVAHITKTSVRPPRTGAEFAEAVQTIVALRVKVSSTTENPQANEPHSSSPSEQDVRASIVKDILFRRLDAGSVSTTDRFNQEVARRVAAQGKLT